MTHYLDAAKRVPNLRKEDMIDFLYGGLKKRFPRRFGLKKLLCELPTSSIKRAYIALYGEGSVDKAVQMLGLQKVENENPFGKFSATAPDYCSDCGTRVWEGQQNCALCGAKL